MKNLFLLNLEDGHQPVFPLYSVKHTYFDSNRKSICHGHIMPLRWITLLLFFLGNLNYAFSQATVTASGTWTTATWSPAAPVAGQSVTVNVGCTLTVDQSTPPLNDLTINGVVIISNTAVSIMTIGGNITVNAGGRLRIMAVSSSQPLERTLPLTVTLLMCTIQETAGCWMKVFLN